MIAGRACAWVISRSWPGLHSPQVSFRSRDCLPGGTRTARGPGMEAVSIATLAALSLACRQAIGLVRQERDRGAQAGRRWGHGRCGMATPFWATWGGHPRRRMARHPGRAFSPVIRHPVPGGSRSVRHAPAHHHGFARGLVQVNGDRPGRDARNDGLDGDATPNRTLPGQFKRRQRRFRR